MLLTPLSDFIAAIARASMHRNVADGNHHDEQEPAHRLFGVFLIVWTRVRVQCHTWSDDCIKLSGQSIQLSRRHIA